MFIGLLPSRHNDFETSECIVHAPSHAGHAGKALDATNFVLRKAHDVLAQAEARARPRGDDARLDHLLRRKLAMNERSALNQPSG